MGSPLEAAALASEAGLPLITGAGIQQVLPYSSPEGRGHPALCKELQMRAGLTRGWEEG